MDPACNFLKTKKHWLKIADLALEFGISRSTAYEWAAAGAFGVPFQPAGPNSALLFSREQVNAAIRANQEKLSADLGIPIT